MLRIAVLLSLSSLVGCRCLAPVMETDAGQPDAGQVSQVDAGLDGGLPVPDAGSGGDGGCSTELDCPLEGPAGLCAANARQSCIDGRCIRECRPLGRTCRTIFGDPRCLQCTRPEVFTACSNDQPNTCGVSRCSGRLTVERSTCPNLLPELSELTSEVDPQTCLQSALKTDGSGEVMSFFSITDLELSGRFQGLGTCVSRSAVTGAVRSLWACPNNCEFQILGCE